MRFSIRSLFALVAFIAIGLAAVLNPNVWWDGALRDPLLLALVYAVWRIAAGDRGKFWTGFAVAGGLTLYFVTRENAEFLLPFAALASQIGQWTGNYYPGGPDVSPEERNYLFHLQNVCESLAVGAAGVAGGCFLSRSKRTAS